jgi:hypothetical protein
MEEQISPSIPAPENLSPAPAPTFNFPPTITPEIVEMMKARAREEAIRLTMEKKQATPVSQMQVPADFQRAPQVVYIRRNLTLAELLLTILLACGLVTGVQFSWHFITSQIPRIHVEIK